MSRTSTQLRRRIAVLALTVVAAFSLVAAPTVASPATYPAEELTTLEAQNGDWPW